MLFKLSQDLDFPDGRRLSRRKGNDQRPIQSNPHLALNTKLERTRTIKTTPNKNSRSGKPRGQLFPSGWPKGYPKYNEQLVKDKQKTDEHRQLE